MDLGLDGRRALVVGGSQGIGRATAALLLAEGAEVGIVSRNLPTLEATAAELERETGRHPQVFSADVTQEGSGEEIAGFVSSAFGTLDVLVTAVGGSVRADFASLGDADWLANYSFNVLSTVRVIRAMTPLLAEGRAPAIVTLGAAAAKMPYPHQIMSKTHKAGLIALVKTLAVELAASGIRINSVGPGRTRTPLWIRRADAIAAERGIDRETVIAEFSAEIPLGRFAEPEEIAVMVAWLASPRASYVTGQTVNVDGGIARGLL